MATDGLWDYLSSKQGVDLVGNWLEPQTAEKKSKPELAIIKNDGLLGSILVLVTTGSAVKYGGVRTSYRGVSGGGRVLGLTVSRAFGDSLWKWPLDFQKEMKQKFNGPPPLTPRYSKHPPSFGYVFLARVLLGNADDLFFVTTSLID
jgi:hypothetical protein